MVTMYDAPVDALLDAAAEKLAERSEIDEPSWMTVAKAGDAKQLSPEQEDFWYRRVASVLRKVAKDGPVGVERLRTEYGDSKQGSNRYRVAPRHASEGSGKIIREVLTQLEAVDFVEAAGGEGRRVTAEGQGFLDDTAGEVLQDISDPDLERYA